MDNPRKKARMSSDWDNKTGCNHLFTEKKTMRIHRVLIGQATNRLVQQSHSRVEGLSPQCSRSRRKGMILHRRMSDRWKTLYLPVFLVQGNRIPFRRNPLPLPFFVQRNINMPVGTLSAKVLAIRSCSSMRSQRFLRTPFVRTPFLCLSQSICSCYSSPRLPFAFFTFRFPELRWSFLFICRLFLFDDLLSLFL